MPRRKCFLSYHKQDINEVEEFIETFDFGHRSVLTRSINERENRLVNSTDPDYIMRQIREVLLAESTVTIVLIGKNTWSRKFVDWEIYSSLRNDRLNSRNGVLGIVLPSVQRGVYPPERLADNLPNFKNQIDGYARCWYYPKSKEGLEEIVEDAFEARQTRRHLIRNKRRLFIYNRSS